MYEDGDTVTYKYDNSGALATVTDSATGITTTYYYDFTDRLMKYADVLMCSEKTIYNLLNAGAFDADRLDFPRIVRMRKRKTAPGIKIDRHCYDGRTFKDYVQFTTDNSSVQVVQMDTVIGRK